VSVTASIALRGSEQLVHLVVDAMFAFLRHGYFRADHMPSRTRKVNVERSGRVRVRRYPPRGAAYSDVG
jgi:hypothetical protein